MSLIRAKDGALVLGPGAVHQGHTQGRARQMLWRRRDKVRVAIVQQHNPEQPNVRFGVDENQVHHTFRHTDQLGLDRNAVSNAIRADLAGQGPASPGQPSLETSASAGLRSNIERSV
jgi:hypothetical protein